MNLLESLNKRLAGALDSVYWTSPEKTIGELAMNSVKLILKMWLSFKNVTSIHSQVRGCMEEECSNVVVRFNDERTN